MVGYRLAMVLITAAIITPDLTAADHVTLSGKVVDSAGKPIAHATVLIYHAGVKKGYSTFCPSCYSDCGKRAITNPDGTFAIQNVDADLLFQLLAVGDGFQPAFVNRVDPLNSVGPKALLLPKTKSMRPQNVVVGRVTDEQGRPLRDAVVQPEGISMPANQSEVSRYGTIKGLDPLAVTDEKGDFEIANEKPAFGMLLKIEVRGLAPKLQALPTGAERKTVTISQGAVVRGRLVDHGQPVAGAEIGLIAENRGGFGGKLTVIGNPYEEIRVGTQANGTFTLADVPPSVDWYVYAKMESVSTRGATEPLLCTSGRSGKIVDVGDLQLQPGHRLRGAVLLPNGAHVPQGMRITIASHTAFDSQTVLIQQDGSFEYVGLPTGSYEIFPSVRGFHLSSPMENLIVDHDIDSLSLALDPNSPL